MKRYAVLSIAIAAAGLSAGGALAAGYTGQQLAGQAKVTMAQATSIALKARPGVIVDKELEKEAGGSGLRYAFDVKSHGVTYEVGVDAKTGKVLENGAESAADEAKEAKADAKPHH
jgi:uncharacterized membrane protein YkoI